MFLPFLLSIIAGLSTFIGALFVLFSKYNNIILWGRNYGYRTKQESILR